MIKGKTPEEIQETFTTISKKDLVSSLPYVPKRKIFECINKLSIGCRFNASIVWEELADETKKAFLTNERLIQNLTGSSALIDNLEDLETASVMAFAGHLDSVTNLRLRHIDVTSIPINLVNSLFKVVRGELMFNNVSSLCFSMLEDIKCEELSLIDMAIPTQEKRDISVSGEVFLKNITGDLSALFESLICDGMNSLEINDIDVSDVPTTIVNNLAKSVRRKLVIWRMVSFSSSILENIKCEDLDLGDMTIESQMTQDLNINGTVILLRYLSGDPIGLYERITCDWLMLEEQKIEKMSFLEEILQTRVRVLSFLSYPEAFDCSVLTNYDGEGKCEP